MAVEQWARANSLPSCWALAQILVVFCFVIFSTMPRDWLERMSLKWPILCRVGRKTLTQSINYMCLKVLTVAMETNISMLHFRLVTICCCVTYLLWKMCAELCSVLNYAACWMWNLLSMPRLTFIGAGGGMHPRHCKFCELNFPTGYTICVILVEFSGFMGYLFMGYFVICNY